MEQGTGDSCKSVDVHACRGMYKKTGQQQQFTCFFLQKTPDIFI